MKPSLTEEELKAHRKVAVLCNVPRDASGGVMTIAAGDVLAMVDEIEGARQHRPPSVLITYDSRTDGPRFIWNDSLKTAEQACVKAIERGDTTYATIHTCRIEQVWEVKTTVEAKRTK